MNRALRSARAALAAVFILAASRSAQAFLGVADTSFVTVIANPAEAANWAAELDSLNNQLEAARGTLQTVSDLKAFAGDPKAAVEGLGDLSGISGAVGALESGSQTQSDLAKAWAAIGAAQQQAGISALLQGSGPGSTMQVFGQVLPRDPALYARMARTQNASSQIRSQIADEQSARASVASELALAWSQLRAASTESGKQAILTEISQLQSQNQVMDARRRALVDDLALSDRQAGTAAAVRSKAADEQMLAESAALNAATESRALSAETQRLATLQKAPAPFPAPDYTGIRLWTPADAGGPSR